MTAIPPGVTLNNPFDLMYDPHINWMGQIRPASGHGLLGFDSALHGLRAGMKDAHTKVYVHKFNTLEKFFYEFAPPNQNDTEQYIDHMSEWLPLGRKDLIELDTVAKLVNWGKCCNRQEVGFRDEATHTPWYTDDLYQYAARLALEV